MSSTFIIQLKTTAIQIKTCVNTMMRSEWIFLLFAYLFQSFIYLFSLEVKIISSWDYSRNCYLHSISFDAFGDINNEELLVLEKVSRSAWCNLPYIEFWLHRTTTWCLYLSYLDNLSPKTFLIIESPIMIVIVVGALGLFVLIFCL